MIHYGLTKTKSLHQYFGCSIAYILKKVFLKLIKKMQIYIKLNVTTYHLIA